jgi:ABC-2 type transport system permease protein
MISLFLVSSIFIVAILLYTIFFASLFKTTIGWTEVLAFSTYPLFLISGYSWPIDAMPKIMQLIANLLPTTPYYKLFSNLSHSGTNIEHNATSIIHLLSLLILGYLALYLRFTFMRRKKLNQISKL